MPDPKDHSKVFGILVPKLPKSMTYVDEPVDPERDGEVLKGVRFTEGHWVERYEDPRAREMEQIVHDLKHDPAAQSEL